MFRKSQLNNIVKMFILFKFKVFNTHRSYEGRLLPYHLWYNCNANSPSAGMRAKSRSPCITDSRSDVMVALRSSRRIEYTVARGMLQQHIRLPYLKSTSK